MIISPPASPASAPVISMTRTYLASTLHPPILANSEFCPVMRHSYPLRPLLMISQQTTAASTMNKTLVFTPPISGSHAAVLMGLVMGLEAEGSNRGYVMTHNAK